MKKQQNQRTLSNAGFSLLEVILSMAILAILSIPLLSYFTQSMKYNAKMADKQHASNLAQEVMENLKNQPNLVQNADASGFDVPYLEAENYVKASYTPAAPGPTETGGFLRTGGCNRREIRYPGKRQYEPGRKSKQSAADGWN